MAEESAVADMTTLDLVLQCFFTVPALVYLVMVPRWPRAAKIANVHVFAIVDVLFAVCYQRNEALREMRIRIGNVLIEGNHAYGLIDILAGSIYRCSDV